MEETASPLGTAHHADSNETFGRGDIDGARLVEATLLSSINKHASFETGQAVEVLSLSYLRCIQAALTYVSIRLPTTDVGRYDVVLPSLLDVQLGVEQPMERSRLSHHGMTTSST